MSSPPRSEAPAREMSDNSWDPLTVPHALHRSFEAPTVTPDHLRAVYDALALRIHQLGSYATEEDLQLAREQCAESWMTSELESFTTWIARWNASINCMAHSAKTFRVRAPRLGAPPPVSDLVVSHVE